MTRASKIAYALIVFIMIFTALVYGAVHEPIIAIFYLMVALMAVLWAVDGYSKGEIHISPSLLQLPIYLVGIYGLIQVIPFGSYSAAGVDGIPRTISLDPFSTQENALHFLALALFFSVALVMVNSVKRIRRLVLVITIFGFVFAFFAILQGVLSPTKIYGIYERQFAQPYGSFVNRHNFAAYMEMTLSIPLALVLTGNIRRDQRLLYLTAVVLMAVALLLSGSRGGLVAMLAEIMLLILMTSPVRSSRKLVLRLALGAALLAAVIAGAIFVGGESSLTRIAETTSSKDVTTSRTHIWAVASKMAFQNLPFGVGLGAFGVAFTPLDSHAGLERVEQAHNDYLQTITDAGLVGLILGGAFLFFLVRTAISAVSVNNNFRRGVAAGSFAGLFAVLVHSLFDFVLHTTAISVLFLILTTLLVACGREYGDETKDGGDQRPRKRGSVHPIRRSV
jgi:O-antigen ligase